MHCAHNAAVRDWERVGSEPRAREGEDEGRGAVRRWDCRWGACRLGLEGGLEERVRDVRGARARPMGRSEAVGRC
jgi:hypothetical protein